MNLGHIEQVYTLFPDESYGGYSGSGHGWDTFSDDGRDGNRDGDSSGSSEDGWYTYNKNTIWRDNDDEDF